MKHSMKPIALTLLLASVTGCAAISSAFNSITDSIGGLFSSDSDGGPGQVNELVGKIERVYVESEVSKEKMQAAVDALRAVSEGKFQGDPTTAYTTLVEAGKQSEEQAQKLRDNYENMQEAAEPFFEEWTENLKKYTNPDMRLRSQSRLAATRQRYEAIVAAVEPALIDYDTVNKGLRDYTLFLGHDMNPSALAEIQDGVNQLSQRAALASRSFDACLVAARAYVDASALPAQPDQPAGKAAAVQPQSQPSTATQQDTQIEPAPQSDPKPPVKVEPGNG